MRDSGKVLPACSRNERTSSAIEEDCREARYQPILGREGEAPSRSGGMERTITHAGDRHYSQKKKTPPSPISLPPNVLGMNKK